jgi:UV damage endonuclease UvdE
MKKIGFACKYKSKIKDKKISKEEEQHYNTKSTTLRHLKTLSKEESDFKMDFIIKHNLESTFRLLEYVKKLPKELQMLRLTSDLLPFYTHKDLENFYKDKTVKNTIETGLLKIGDFARKENIRLSFHPGQFCVLASDTKEIIERSIEEFEYHTEMAKMMGYAKKFQDLKCNIHISGKGGVEEFRKTFKKLSPESRNIITVENAEYKYGLDDCLKVSDLCPIVLDVHHFWIMEEYYIDNKDPRIKKVLDSWRGVRPTMHYSQSREEHFDIKKEKNLQIDIKALLNGNYNKRMLAAHSDMMWNNSLNKEIAPLWEDFDIMVEAKNKNLASIDLLKKIKRL